VADGLQGISQYGDFGQYHDATILADRAIVKRRYYLPEGTLNLLSILDISNPSDPPIIFDRELEHYVGEIALCCEFLFCAQVDSMFGYRIVDDARLEPFGVFVTEQSGLLAASDEVIVWIENGTTMNVCLPPCAGSVPTEIRSLGDVKSLFR